MKRLPFVLLAVPLLLSGCAVVPAPTRSEPAYHGSYQVYPSYPVYAAYPYWPLTVREKVVVHRVPAPVKRPHPVPAHPRPPHSQDAGKKPHHGPHSGPSADHRPPRAFPLSPTPAPVKPGKRPPTAASAPPRPPQHGHPGGRASPGDGSGRPAMQPGRDPGASERTRPGRMPGAAASPLQRPPRLAPAPRSQPRMPGGPSRR